MLIKQHDISDCGAACLASIALHYKLKLSLSKIRKYANTDINGTNVLGLIAAATKLGFEANGVKGTFDSLSKIPLPAIAHVVVREHLHHYVVIYKVSKKYITVMDPADGKMHHKSTSEFAREWTSVLVLMIPNENFKQGDEKIATLSRFIQLLKPQAIIMWQALFGAMIYTILGLSTAIFIQKITDYVLVSGDRNLLSLMSIIMMMLLLLQLFIGVVKNIFILRTGQQIDVRLILGYYKHLLKLPQQFFDTMRVGEITSRFNDAIKIRAFINDVSISVAVNVFIVFFSFVLMFTYYWKLGLVMLMALPLYLLIFLVTNLLNKKTQRRLMEESADLESQLVESLSAIGTIKRFDLADFNNTKTETKFIKLLRTTYRSATVSIFSRTSTELVAQLLTIILLWTGTGYVLDQEITPGELFSFYSLIGYFTAPAAALIGSSKIIQDAVIAAERLFDIMDLDIEIDNSSISLTTHLIGDIHFDKVAFSYGTRSEIFENLSLKIKSGSFTAIVGESGSGKSTLMSLLQNIYPIQSGTIFIGQYALKYLDNASIRRLVSVVPQKIDLFAGNVIENITVGDNDPDIKRVIDICTQLGIINFIEELPGGFETYLGENGATISGGQKQRIAIARALYRNPEILILDEATSSLDHVSEMFVKQAIELLLKQRKTIIVIAHRLTTIRHADHIILLKNGSVAEQGSHDDMLLNKKHYHKLWHQQFSEMGLLTEEVNQK